MDNDEQPETEPTPSAATPEDERDIPHESDLQDPAGDNVVTGTEEVGPMVRPTRIN